MEFFDDGIGEDFTRNSLDRLPRSCLVETVEGNFEVLALANVTDALVAHLAQRAVDGLALRIEDRFLHGRANYTLRVDAGALSSFAMKTAAWFIISELLLILTIVLVFSHWQGNVNFSFSWPLSGSTLSITGGAQGGRVFLALASAILTVATFVAGLIRLFKRSVKVATTSASATTNAS